MQLSEMSLETYGLANSFLQFHLIQSISPGTFFNFIGNNDKQTDGRTDGQTETLTHTDTQTHSQQHYDIAFTCAGSAAVAKPVHLNRR